MTQLSVRRWVTVEDIKSHRVGHIESLTSSCLYEVTCNYGLLTVRDGVVKSVQLIGHDGVETASGIASNGVEWRLFI